MGANKRCVGFLYHFNAKLSELYPDIAEAVQIHRLPDAHLPFSDQFNADEVERMLIAFFGYRTLLNRQRGGHYGSYIPTSADVGNFGQLGTSFYHDFLVKARHPDARMVDELGTIFKRVRVDANTDSTTSGTCVYQFTEELQRSITEAATPRQIFGHTLILYTLKDITVEDYYDPRPFIKGGSRAGTLTRAMIRQLAEVEEQEAERFWTDGTFRPTFFTAANLFNTLWHRAPDQAFADLQEYFGIVRPLISATFSRDVNALLLSDFGLENENYLHDSVFPTVGTVTLQHFGETPGTDDAFLSIQHIDPGYDKYEYQPPELRRIMFLTHQITFLVANEAMEVLEEYYQRGQHRDRLTICAEIYGRVEGIKVTPAGRQLFNDLASAKAEYQPMFSSKNIVAAFGRLPSQDPYPLLDFYGRQKILSLGRLAGKPQSYERWQQIEQYWDEHYPDLHVTYPHGDEQSYNDWAALFMGAPENQFWLLHALAHSGKSKYLGILLAQYRPFWKLEEKDWINDEKARHEAAVAAGAWLNTIANHSTRILKTRKQIGLQQPEDVKNLDDLQGSRVSVSGRGNVVRLRWQHQPDGHVNAVEVPAAPAKMISAEDERYLDFTEHGIDVLDGYGVPLRAVTRQGQREATIPKNSFHGYKFGKEVYEMWILVRTRMGHAPPPDADEPDYQWQWDLEQGVNWVQQMTLIEDPVQDRPPWENDANYLLVSLLPRSSIRC